MNRRIPIQNIPLRTDLGRRLRQAFFGDMPPLGIDYRSIEYRILAHLKIREGEAVKKNEKDIDKLFAEKRFCYFVPVDGLVDGYGFRPSLVFENEPGHFPVGTWPYEGKPGQTVPWFWGPTYDEAVACADKLNDSMGINPEEAFKIVTSSMARQKSA